MACETKLLRKMRPVWFFVMMILVRFAGEVRADTAGLEPASITNGACVFTLSLKFHTNMLILPRSFRPPPEDLPVEIRRAFMSFRVAQQWTALVHTETNLVFSHFIKGSLNYLVWTNVLAHTNGRSIGVWRTRARSPGWPTTPPQATWNHQSLLWGMKGFTALSPSWEGEGNPGQIPITALTRRHGYTRGHDMGPSGFHSNFAGKRVWFLTASDRIVERRVLREVVRTVNVDSRDYTIVLFDRDLPDDIQPISVASRSDVYANGPTRYCFCSGGPLLLFLTEQTGAVSVDLPGFRFNTGKGGDSGSPNMLPMPKELVFVSGRSTSGASAEMQADMDELCRLQGISPKKYRLRWFKFSGFPFYH